MNKNKKLLKRFIAIICSVIFIICFGLWASKAFHSKELIYSTTYVFGLGSRKVQIYDNGDVYDDLEIEDPNHETNYQYVKTLTTDQVHELKDKKEQGVSGEELSDFVIELVYGVKEFDDMGGY